MNNSEHSPRSERKAPSLDEKSARILSEALARHDTVRSRSGSRRRNRDPLRSDVDLDSDVEGDEDLDLLGDTDVRGAIEVDVVDTEPVGWREKSPPENRSLVGVPPTAPESSRSKAMFLVGALFVGVAVALVAWSLFSVASEDDPITPEVAAAVEEAPVVADAEPAETSPPNSVDAPAVEEAQSTESDALEPIETPPPALDIEVNFEMNLYDVGAAISGVQSFAVLVRHDDESETVETDRLSVEVEAADGSEVIAVVRFEQPDVPPGSSAIAAVRTESDSAGPFEVVLTLDGAEVARGQLGPGAAS